MKKKDPDADRSGGDGLESHTRSRRERAFLIRCPSPFQTRTTLWNLRRSPRSPQAREQLLRQINQWSKNIVGQPSRTFRRRTHHYFSRSLPCSYSLLPFPSCQTFWSVAFLAGIQPWLFADDIWIPNEDPSRRNARISLVQPISLTMPLLFTLVEIPIYLDVPEIYRNLRDTSSPKIQLSPNFAPPFLISICTLLISSNCRQVRTDLILSETYLLFSYLILMSLIN